jgi:hypothetical protein
MTGTKFDLEELRSFVREEAYLADKSSHEWDAAYPNCQNAAYRAGMWWAMHLVEMKFPPEPNKP